MLLDCHQAGCDGQIEVTYDNLGEVVACPVCHTEYEVGYDESLDSEGDEYAHWWLESLGTRPPTGRAIADAESHQRRRADVGRR